MRHDAACGLPHTNPSSYKNTPPHILPYSLLQFSQCLHQFCFLKGQSWSSFIIMIAPDGSHYIQLPLHRSSTCLSRVAHRLADNGSWSIPQEVWHPISATYVHRVPHDRSQPLIITGNPSIRGEGRGASITRSPSLQLCSTCTPKYVGAHAHHPYHVCPVFQQSGLGLTWMDDRTLVSGVKYPNLAASACAFWVVSRVLYTIGYTTGDAAKVRCSSRDMNFGWHSRILGQRNRLGGILGELPFLGACFCSKLSWRS